MNNIDKILFKGILFSTILYCCTLLISDFFSGIFFEIMNVISIVFICIIIIYVIFNIFSKKDILKNCYYIGFHLIFALLPFGMFLQYKYINNNMMIYISLIIVLILSFLVNKKLKTVDIKHIYKLKYSNILLFSIFTIFFALLDIKTITIELYIYISCISPFIILQVIYERIITDKNVSDEENNGHAG